MSVRRGAACLLLAVTLPACGPTARQDPARGFVVVGATLIDGSGPAVSDAFVVIRSGRILDLGPQSHVPLPKDLPIIDARGKYIVPAAAGLQGPEAIAALRAAVGQGQTPIQAIDRAVGEAAALHEGRPADLLILDLDPRLDVGHLTAIHRTVRGGHLVETE